jgi:hypothetical protein
MILKKYGKQASAVISDSLPAAVNGLDTSAIEKSLGGARDFILKLDVTKAEVDKLRYEMADGKLNVVITPYKGNFAPSDVTFGYGDSQVSYDVVIVLGVAARSRIDRLYDQHADALADVPLINIDFHRTNESYGAVNLIDSNASSLCEILVALSESLQGGIIDADIATPLLMGLMASTDRFTATHTTSKSLTVAAQMMAAGGRQQAVVRALYRDGRGNDGRSSDGRSNDSRERDRDRDKDRDRERERTPQPSQPTKPAAESRREQQPARREPQPVEQRTSAPAPEPEVELPIIAPSHIELMQPEVAQSKPVEAPRPVAEAALVPAPASMPAPAPVVAPGQLPPEMSPLVDLAAQSVSIHPDQAELVMPMPSTVRNDA